MEPSQTRDILWMESFAFNNIERNLTVMMNGNAKLYRIGAAILALAILLTALAGCTSEQEEQEQRVVGTSAGYDVLYEELRLVTLGVKSEMRSEYGEDIWSTAETAETYRAELETRVLEQLEEKYLVLAACDALDISTDTARSKSYVEEQINELIEEECGGKKEKYESYLRENNWTDNLMRFYLHVSYMESVLYYTLLDTGYFDYRGYNSDTGANDTPDFIEHIMTSPDYAHTIHVYLKSDGDRTADEVKKEAESVTRALRAVGGYEQRLTIMKGYVGSSLNKDTGDMGNGYYFTRGEMDETYEEKTFELEVGEVSDPFPFGEGYMVIMRVEPDMAYVTSNASTLLINYHGAQMGLLEANYAERCRVTLNEYGLSLDLTAIE